jgi:thioredoxin 1
MVDFGRCPHRMIGKRRPSMRTPTITFVLALLIVAGCAPRQTPAPAAQTQAQPETSTNLPKLWDFWATWCPPCKELTPTVEALAGEYEGKIEIKSINVDENKELAQKFEIKAIPTLVFLDAKGNELSRIVGLVPRDTIVGRFKAHGFIE